MNMIEKQIHEHFASLPEQTDGETSHPAEAPQEPLRDYVVPDLLMDTFAKVDTVTAGSPADEAGLKVNDQIRNFGYVNHSNHDNLKRVAECVQNNEGVRHTWCHLVAREIKFG